jgi:glycosyltransferase involved in cell wall biosynthesis
MPRALPEGRDQDAGNAKVRVLHIYRTYFPDPPGGLQEAIRQICVATAVRGVTPSVFTLTPDPRPDVIELDHARVIRGRSWWAPASCDLGDFQAVVRFLRCVEEADVLHFHYPWPFADFLNLLPQLRGKRKVMTYHSDIVRQRVLGSLYAPLMRHTLGTMDAVVATSPNYAATSDVLQRHVAGEKLRIIPLGVEDRACSRVARQGDAEILDRLGLHGRPYVLSLGVLRYYKGLDTLVRAAPTIDATVVIAGSGPQAEFLHSLAGELGADNVVFAGQVTDTERDALLTACSAFVFPSHLRSEAFGMALVEASMFSKPMITCEIGSGMSYVNDDGVTGCVVPPLAPEAFSAAVNRLLADDSLARRMGEAARARYLKLFSGDALGKSYAALYSSLL